MSILFVVLYIVLGIGTIVVLRRLFKNNPVEKELANAKGGDKA
jgi:cytochrome d ubiquinol oxidase subunit I